MIDTVAEKISQRFRCVHHPAIEQLPADRITLMEVPALAISSTACRERVMSGEPIWYLVPDGIVQYIAKRGLYRDRQAEQERPT